MSRQKLHTGEHSRSGQARTMLGTSLDWCWQSKVGRKKSPDGQTVQLVGRTVCDRIVVFDGPATLAGRILPVRIEKVAPFTLFGRWVNHA